MSRLKREVPEVMATVRLERHLSEYSSPRLLEVSYHRENLHSNGIQNHNLYQVSSCKERELNGNTLDNEVLM